MLLTRPVHHHQRIFQTIASKTRRSALKLSHNNSGRKLCVQTISPSLASDNINENRFYPSNKIKPRIQRTYLRLFSEGKQGNRDEVYRNLITKDGPVQVYVLTDDNYDSVSEYMALPADIDLNADVMTKDTKTLSEVRMASLFRKRNIIFGARAYGDKIGRIESLCQPLLEKARDDASEFGDQPQALANLNGLCNWVRSSFELIESGKEDNDCTSEVLRRLNADQSDEGKVTYEAVRAIATGIPRPGHSVVGVGTFRDGESGWKMLAKEYASNSHSTATDDGTIFEGSNEANLYRNGGGVVVKIELLGNTSEAYLRDAGGAMARFFFM